MQSVGFLMSVLVLIFTYSKLSKAYNYPPQTEPDCAEMCELQIDQCFYEERCQQEVTCERRCHTLGSQCYGRCLLRLMDEGKFEIPRRRPQGSDVPDVSE